MNLGRRLDALKSSISSVLPLLSPSIQTNWSATFSACKDCVDTIEHLEDDVAELERYIEELEEEPEFPAEIEEILDILTSACISGFDAYKLEELLTLHKSFMKHERNTIL